MLDSFHVFFNSKKFYWKITFKNPGWLWKSLYFFFFLISLKVWKSNELRQNDHKQGYFYWFIKKVNHTKWFFFFIGIPILMHDIMHFPNLLRILQIFINYVSITLKTFDLQAYSNCFCCKILLNNLDSTNVTLVINLAPFYSIPKFQLG